MNVEKRQEIERKVIRHLIRTMKEAHWIITRINDGGEDDEDIIDPNETQAMDAVFSVDESTIYFHKRLDDVRGMTHFAFIVLGNDGYDCICDHSCSTPHVMDDFEKIMNEVQEYADKFCE